MDWLTADEKEILEMSELAATNPLRPKARNAGRG
jgi:hypothetical protein